jgi:hypothetical protein
MGINPPVPPPPIQPNPPGGQNLQDALAFAQALADREIASIERIHGRTLRYIGFVLTAFVAGFGLLGYFGFKNLHDLTVGVASRQVKAEATKQVQQQLTKNGITEIVRQQTHEFAATELRSQIHAEISAGPLHQEIISTAAAQSQQLINKTIGQRHLTQLQAAKLKTAIKERPELAAYPFETIYMPMNPEAARYSREIFLALLDTAMVKAKTSASAAAEGSDGVEIFYDEKFGAKWAESLAEAFRAAGVSARLREAPFDEITEPGKKPTLIVYVGPRSIPDESRVKPSPVP